MKPAYASLFAVVLALLLAGCGRAPAPEAIDPTDGDFVTLTLGAEGLPNDASLLAPQGVPTDTHGDSVVEHLEIRVHTSDGQPVSFDSENTFDPDGASGHLVIDEGASSVTLRLPTGEYVFEAAAFSTRGRFVAYGTTSSRVTFETANVHLDVHALHGGATLEPNVPLHYIVPGQTLDLYLSVVTRIGRHNVPTTDYDVSYEVAENMGRLENGSEVGARIVVTDDAPANDFEANAAITGWAPDGKSPHSAAYGAPGGAIFTRPFLQATGAMVDLAPPTLTLAAPERITPGRSLVLAGTADDEIGIDRVRVYEGPVLIGSTHVDEHADPDVEQITFDDLTDPANTGWSMSWTPTTDAPSGLKAVAIDTSGNQAEALTSFIYDRRAPQVTLDEPGTVKAGEAITLTGTVDEETALGKVNLRTDTVLASSDPDADVPLVTVGADGRWSAPWTPQEAGTVTMRVFAHDEAGNVGSDSLEILVEEENGASLIAAGWFFSIAVGPDGMIHGWGNNTYGQADHPTGLTNIVSLDAGEDHSLALRDDGTVVAWGSNSYGQATVPSGATNIIAVAAGNEHSLALREDGEVLAWGRNALGETNVPANAHGAVAIAAGTDLSLALKSDGTVVAWGTDLGQQAEVPAGLDDVVSISAGMFHVLALKSDGTVVSWGMYTDVPAGLTDVVTIAAGGHHSLALRSDGTIEAWGANTEGETEVPVGLRVQTSSFD